MVHGGFFSEVGEGDSLRFYTDGQWQSSKSNQSVDIIDPSTNTRAFKVAGWCNSYRACPGASGARPPPSRYSKQQPLTSPAPHPPGALHACNAACTKEEVDAAFASAKAAQKVWWPHLSAPFCSPVAPLCPGRTLPCPPTNCSPAH